MILTASPSPVPTSPIDGVITVPSTPPAPAAPRPVLPGEIEWTEGKLFGLGQSKRELTLHSHEAVDGYPSVYATTHKTFDSPSSHLPAAVLANMAGPRAAYDQLVSAYQQLTPADLASVEPGLPAKGMMHLSDADPSTPGYQHAAFPLRSDNPRTNAFADAARGFFNVVGKADPAI